MYSLEALIATEPVLRELAGATGAPIVSLGRHLSLAPMTDTSFAAAPGAPRLDRFRMAPADFGTTLTTCSAIGPVACVEAEFFGGTAQARDGGKVVLGPLHLTDEEDFPADGSPISQALRRLGIVRGEHFDEFAAVELGRHRETAGWLPSAS